MTRDQSKISKEIESALQKIADNSHIKLKSSSVEKFTSLLRNIQDRGNLTPMDKEKLKQKPIETLKYMVYLLEQTTAWENGDYASQLKLGRSFLKRITKSPDSRGKLTLCYELAKCLYACQFERHQQFIEVLAAAEKSLLSAEAKVKQVHLCLSCNRMTQGFQIKSHSICGFCGEKLSCSAN